MARSRATIAAMAEHREDGDRAGPRARSAFSGLMGAAITAVRVVGAIFALILVIHILLTVFEANPDNGITRFFADVSSGLTLGFDGLFTPDDPKLAVLVNYGIAAVFWLVAAAVIVRVLRAVR